MKTSHLKIIGQSISVNKINNDSLSDLIWKMIKRNLKDEKNVDLSHCDKPAELLETLEVIFVIDPEDINISKLENNLVNITSSVHEQFSFEFIVGEFQNNSMLDKLPLRQISIEFDGKITIDLIGHPDNWSTIEQLGWLIDSDEKAEEMLTTFA
ncbi:MAG: hypothetical protein ACRCZW_13965 [Lactobacillaceae bacterium]